MHLLAAQAGAIQQEGEAIDLCQTPAPVIFAGSADSELAMLAGAVDRAGFDGLRLANLLKLSHNLSVDLWVDETVRHARLVVLRLIGGPAYWQYGVDELTALALGGTIKLVLLPGDANPDPILRERSGIAAADWDRLLGLFTAGGPDNADSLLAAFRMLAEAKGDGPVLGAMETQPFARFGLWWPGRGMVGDDELAGIHRGLPTPTPSSPARGEVPDGGWGEIRGASDLSAPASPSPLWGGSDHRSGVGVESPGARRSPPPVSATPIHPPHKGEGGDGTGSPGGHERPRVPILFYRAALEGAGTATLEALVAEMVAQGLAPVPFVVSSLKEGACARFVKAAFAAFPPAAIFNLTGFALGIDGLDAAQNPFAGTDAPVIQLVQAGRAEAQWESDWQGLNHKDLAMFVVLPELDGRIGMPIVGHKENAVWHAATECALSSYAPDASGIFRAVRLAANWARLRVTPVAERRVGIVLSNYPLRDGRLANGVGYDAPESTVEILKALEGAGYGVLPSPLAGEGGAQRRMRGEGQETPHPPFGHPLPQWEREIPATGANLVDRLLAGPTNAEPQRGEGVRFSLERYRQLFADLPQKIQDEVSARWGEPSADPFLRGENFHLPALIYGNVTVLLQPSRGYGGDETVNYHDPYLVPPHAYIAAYLWLRGEFGAQALIHNGKHGNLEWLPGKGVALDEASYPDALWGQLPHLYPFIVNDPGEGTQAKRRTGAVIVDHLVPPLTRAETYGPLKDLEALLDEYYAAMGMDRRRLDDLTRRILDFTRDSRLDRDMDLPADEIEALKTIDNFLCELKEAQIRDGLHILGRQPEPRLLRDLTVALARVPRGERPEDGSLIRALADDLKLGFDPLTARLGDAWTGPRPDVLAAQGTDLWRSNGDAVERLEALAATLVEGAALDPDWTATAAVMATVEAIIKPRLAASPGNEMRALLDGLDGKFIAPGPSGAPTRGRLDTLPTGRNFYSVDNRAVPTPTAWELGRKSAENLCLRHLQDQGVYLRSVALSVWGTANMRTGGDDIAQGLALIGAKPTWDPASLRVSGYEIIPLAKLGRPRVDVTLRISGFFRDAFPAQITLFDRAIRAIGALDEPESENPIAARMRTDALGLMAEGASADEAGLRAGHRIFGSKPGAYGAGLQAMIDSGTWTGKADIAKAFLDAGQYAFGAQAAGVPERERFAARLSDIDAVLHNQDNREHDLLDSDEYYQFEGGLSAASEVLSGVKPLAYHNDHSRPENPVARTLEEEISRVMRSRVVNPKWIAGVMRHGYKGAFEIIATVDFMAAFAATTGAVKSHHFDLAFEAFVEDEAVAEFLRQANRHGWDELLARFRDTIRRGQWTPRSNSAYALLEGEA